MYGYKLVYDSMLMEHGTSRFLQRCYRDADSDTNNELQILSRNSTYYRLTIICFNL